MAKKILSVLFLLILISTVPAVAQGDPHSFSDPRRAKVTHLDLDIEVDFESQQIVGTATWDFQRNSGDRIIFDAKDMQIRSVTSDGKLLPFELGPEVEWLGQPLTVLLPDEAEQVVINYSTEPDAAALQWLKPVQTAGKKHPFLFTQSQAILARTWIPCQDTPGVRFTYDAKVRVDPDLMALMSAVNPTERNEEGVYQFKMPQPIPSYLMALAVGDIEFRALGDVTGIYAEPVMLERSAYEFADTEKMVGAVEEMYGSYRWGRYDMLVLPPSFPFGGMENPRLTFLTPTVIAGDRSLTSLIAHELAHSWSGNLVTNANWNDFWLNEGFTVYLERRIMEDLYGESYAQMLARLGYGDLETSLKVLPAADTHLKLNLEGRDPDVGLTDVAYEKGYLFLVALEKRVGRKRFDKFVRDYFDDNAFGTITTEDFLQRVKAELKADDVIEQWVYSPGLPSSFEPPVSSRFRAVDKARTAFLKGAAKPEQLDTKNWSTHEWLRFLRYLPADTTLSQMATLDRAYNFTDSQNSEILAQWLVASVTLGYEPAYPALESFLTTVGRRKFLEPLYGALIKTPQGRERALAIYKKARPNYHSLSVGTIDEMVGWED